MKWRRRLVDQRGWHQVWISPQTDTKESNKRGEEN
jgi:hypothetical protein